MDDALRERVETLERAVTDGDHDLSAFAEEAEAVERLETLESRTAELEERIEELEAATQALRGYVGNVRSVNADVERRADAALAKAESLEASVSGVESAGPTGDADGAAVGTGRPPSGETEPEPGSNPEPVGNGGASEPTTGRSSHRDDPTPSQRPATDRTGTDRSSPDHCASCGRPHATGDVSAGDQARETASDPSTHPIDGESAGTRRAEAAGRSTPDSGSAQENRGVPTVESLAREDASPTLDGEAEFEEDLVPDGDADPLVGATDGEEAGTLQRIRDLL